MAELLNENDLSQVSGGANSDRVIEYTVKEGDTLAKIATKYHTNVNAIMAINLQIKDVNIVKPGTVIKVPMNF